MTFRWKGSEGRLGDNQKRISALWTNRTENADFYDGPPGRRTNRVGPEWNGVSKQDKLVRMAMMVMMTDNIPSIKLRGIDISKWKKERIDTHKKGWKGIGNGALNQTESNITPAVRHVHMMRTIAKE